MSGYQSGIGNFEKNETVVFGISTDNTPSQMNFAKSLNLTFPLLSDFSNRETAKAYGVLRPDGMCNRTTYVVDKDGKIAYVEVGNTATDPTATDEACSRLAHRTQK